MTHLPLDDTVRRNFKMKGVLERQPNVRDMRMGGVESTLGASALRQAVIFHSSVPPGAVQLCNLIFTPASERAA